MQIERGSLGGDALGLVVEAAAAVAELVRGAQEGGLQRVQAGLCLGVLQCLRQPNHLDALDACIRHRLAKPSVRHGRGSDAGDRARGGSRGVADRAKPRADGAASRRHHRPRVRLHKPGRCARGAGNGGGGRLVRLDGLAPEGSGALDGLAADGAAGLDGLARERFRRLHHLAQRLRLARLLEHALSSSDGGTHRPSANLDHAPHCAFAHLDGTGEGGARVVLDGIHHVARLVQHARRRMHERLPPTALAMLTLLLRGGAALAAAALTS